MSFVYCNPNPDGLLTGDCVIRAIAISENISWEDAYVGVMMEGLMMHKMPSDNEVWGSYLERHGYFWNYIQWRCPKCYTVREFVDEVPGSYILATGTHVVAVKDGNYYDTWDSGNEAPIYYWIKGDGV